jgi:DNA-binding beta-propeller fold protein YncE
VTGLDGNDDGLLLFALLTQSFSPQQHFYTPAGAIEIVDLASLETVRTISIGRREVTSVAVAPDCQRCYVIDRTRHAVVTFTLPAGEAIDSLPLLDPRDCLLSPDGETLYVTAHQSVVAIDTRTTTIRSTFSTAGVTTLGTALSPEADTLAAVGSCPDGQATLYLIDTARLALRASVPITADRPGRTAAPTSVVFTDAGRELLWDSNGDALYQVDGAGQAPVQLHAGTIDLGRQGDSLLEFYHLLVYSASAARAYATKESILGTFEPALAVLDPVGASAQLVHGFTGTPLVPALTPDGTTLFVSVIHRFSGGGADTLDRYDTLSNRLTRNVYTFSVPTMSVRDMRLVRRGPVPAR